MTLRFAGGAQRLGAQTNARPVPAAHVERRRKRTAERANPSGVVGARVRRTPSGGGRQIASFNRDD